MVLTWTFNAYAATAFVGAACTGIHAALFAEVVARSVVTGYGSDGMSAHESPRGAPVFLVVDTVALALVTLHTLQVCGSVAFSSPMVSNALLAVWPIACANWVVRLAVETDIFSNVAAAVALKETLAMQHATSLRRLGGARCPPPNAGRAQQSWFSLVCLLENVKTMALCGSARIFRRAILACSFADWVLLLGVWAAIGVRAQATGGIVASAAVTASSAFAFLAQPQVVLTLPFAAFLTLDAVRLASQLLHSHLLIEAQTRQRDDIAPLRERILGLTLPAGMTTKLTQCVYGLNLANAAMTLALGAAYGSRTVPMVAVKLLIMIRFGRLALECAYLVSTLMARVDRSGFPKPPYTDDITMPPYTNNITTPAFKINRSSFDGLSSAIAAKLDSASARMDDFIAGLKINLPHMNTDEEGKSMTGEERESATVSSTQMGLSKGGGLDTAVEPGTEIGVISVSARGEGGAGRRPGREMRWAGTGATLMTLPEFTEAISTGLRGHLAGEEAEAAAAKLFVEISPTRDSKAIGLNDIQRWLAAQPPLMGDHLVDAGGSVDNDKATDDEDSSSPLTWAYLKHKKKETRWRRSVQRVLRRFVRRAVFGRNQGAFSAFANITAAETAVMEASLETAAPAKRGLRLLSLEGGGIKGLALIWQLRALERAAGRPIHELFDLIGGVSTGGILALGLSRGVPLADLEHMYWDIAGRVFGHQSAVRQLLKGHAADNSAIEELLVKGLRDLPMIGAPEQLVKCFVVTTQQTERLEVRLIRTYLHPNQGRDQSENWKQWEAGMATSSAPTVFAPFVREHPRDGTKQVFIDGALSGYNNPSSLCLNEGLDLAEPGQQIDVLLSLGCGEAPAGGPGVAGGPGGTNLVYWLGQVVNLAFDVQLQEANVTKLIQRFSPQTMHVRLNPPTGSVGLTEHRPDVLARMEDETRQYLAANRTVFTELAEALTTASAPRSVTPVATQWDHPELDWVGDGEGGGRIGSDDDSAVEDVGVGSGQGADVGDGDGKREKAGIGHDGEHFIHGGVHNNSVSCHSYPSGIDKGGNNGNNNVVRLRSHRIPSDPFAEAAEAMRTTLEDASVSVSEPVENADTWIDEVDVAFSWDTDWNDEGGSGATNNGDGDQRRAMDSHPR